MAFDGTAYRRLVHVLGLPAKGFRFSRQFSPTGFNRIIGIYASVTANVNDEILAEITVTQGKNSFHQTLYPNEAYSDDKAIVAENCLNWEPSCEPVHIAVNGLLPATMGGYGKVKIYFIVS